MIALAVGAGRKSLDGDVKKGRVGESPDAPGLRVLRLDGLDGPPGKLPQVPAPVEKILGLELDGRRIVIVVDVQEVGAECEFVPDLHVEVVDSRHLRTFADKQGQPDPPGGGLVEFLGAYRMQGRVLERHEPKLLPLLQSLRQGLAQLTLSCNLVDPGDKDFGPPVVGQARNTSPPRNDLGDVGKPHAPASLRSVVLEGSLHGLVGARNTVVRVEQQSWTDLAGPTARQQPPQSGIVMESLFVPADRTPSGLDPKGGDPGLGQQSNRQV